MKKIYVTLGIAVHEFLVEDVVRTSGGVSVPSSSYGWKDGNDFGGADTY